MNSHHLLYDQEYFNHSLLISKPELYCTVITNQILLENEWDPKINTRPFMDVNMDRPETEKVVFVYRTSFNDGNPSNWNINAILEFYYKGGKFTSTTHARERKFLIKVVENWALTLTV